MRRESHTKSLFLPREEGMVTRKVNGRSLEVRKQEECANLGGQVERYNLEFFVCTCSFLYEDLVSPLLDIYWEVHVIDSNRIMEHTLNGSTTSIMPLYVDEDMGIADLVLVFVDSWGA